jgi:two-component system chemotaxis sensor kinase CheA
MEDQEIIQDFLIESNENLSRVEQEILELEDRPGDKQILGSIFRSFHTVKGTCGFLGFGKLETITHQAEHLLMELRDGKRQFTAAMATLILETLDAVQQELAAIEATGYESDISPTLLLLKLQQAVGTAEAVPAVKVETKVELAAAEAAEAAAEGKAEGTGGGALADQTIRVDTRLVDRLINLVGELVLVRNQVLQSGGTGGGGNDKAIAHRLNLITTELQEGVMRSRMQPVGTIWNKLPRLVRDTAAQLKKDIRLVTEGAGTEMDRTILEAVKDPLTHILRNSCDHGLETPAEREAAGKERQGQVSLRAYHEGSQVVMEVVDDGRGIDPARLRAKAVEKGILTAAAAAAMNDREAVNLVFHAGFSTAEKVTNISGRGVGMDVVKKNIQSIGGQVEIQSAAGKGTKVKIRIPLTLAIIPGLIVGSGGQTFVVPQAHLVELLRLQGDKQRAIEECAEGSVLRWRGTLVPLVDLNAALRLGTATGAGVEVRNIAILEAEGAVFGLMLDRIQATREIVVKPLGKQLKRLNWYAGATILGDGSVALILDVAGLARRERIGGRGEQAVGREEAAEASAKTEQYLLFTCGSYARVAVPLGLVDRLEKFPSESLERTADSWVVQYRGTLLKVAALAKVLGCGGEESLTGRMVNVIVIRRGERVTGLAVDRILDVQRGEMKAASETAASGLLATFVLNGAATELLDLPRVLAAAQPTWDGPKWVAEGNGQAVLVRARTAFVSRSIRQYLELAGYGVEECGGEEAMWRAMEGGGYLAAVLEWPEEGTAEWAEELRARSSAAGTGVIRIGEDGSEAGPEWLLGQIAGNDSARLVELLGEARGKQ